MGKLNRNKPVAAKVKAAAAGAGAGAVVSEFALWVVDAAFFNGDAAPDVPGPVAGFVSLVVVSAMSFAAGWLKTAAPLDDQLDDQFGDSLGDGEV